MIVQENILEGKEKGFPSIEEVEVNEAVLNTLSDKIFGKQNFRQQARFSALLPSEILSDKVKWTPIPVKSLLIENHLLPDE